MSAATFEITAEKRADLGKGASRRLRRLEKVPAVVYGAGKEPMTISLVHDVMLHNLENEAFYSHILTLTVDGQAEKVVLKDLQRHPYKPLLSHLDFQRVSDNTRIRMNVPLHFIGEDKAPGVKQAGGLITHSMNNVEVICQAKDLPEYIEVDLSGLDAGDALHLSDLKMPAGVQVAALLQGADHDMAVAQVTITRAAVEEAATGEGEAEAGSEGGTEA